MCSISIAKSASYLSIPLTSISLSPQASLQQVTGGHTELQCHLDHKDAPPLFSNSVSAYISGSCFSILHFLHLSSLLSFVSCFLSFPLFVPLDNLVRKLS